MKPFEKSVLWPDVQRVMKNGDTSLRFEYTGELHTEKKNIKIVKIISFEIIRDYVNSIGDQFYIEFMIGLGDYAIDLYPFRNNLEFTLFSRELTDLSDSTKKNKPKKEERFKAVFLIEENKSIRASEYENFDIFTLNVSDVVTVKLQLLNRSLEPIRIKTTGGTFANVTNEDLLKSIISSECLKITVDGKPSLDGLDMVEADNKDNQTQLLIPHSTLIVNLPIYLQGQKTGVYNAGIGSYIQSYDDRMTWFIYPLFNPTRLNSKKKKAIFYSVPKNRFPGIEKTYRTTQGVVYILATGGKGYRSTGETDMMNSGAGYRMTDSRSIMKKPVEMTADGPVANRNQLNHEVATIQRKDGLNYAPIASRPISSNPFLQSSQVLQRRGARIDFTWINAKPSLLYPGMPCQFIFLDKDDKAKEVDGILLFVHCYTEMSGKGLMTSSHTTSCQITLFVAEMEEVATE
jgi:hypothetical protein